ncbi:MAG: DNA methyltransferase [Candidatus Diapherotrites archaeon]
MANKTVIAPKEIADWVTFKKNFEHPIHDWFYFKEGFSKELVDWIMDVFGLKGPIYDPFCGCGTTLLAAKQRNIVSYGLDISPLAVLISKVKTRNYDVEKLRGSIAICKREAPSLEIQNKKIFKKYFSSENIEDICMIKQNIKSIPDEKIRDFFMLALMDSATKVALVKKQGRSLRRIKRRPLPIRKIFFEKVEKMVGDLSNCTATGPEPKVIEGDARYFALREKANAIITSPPYLGKEEYAKVYKIELGLFLEQAPKLQTYFGEIREIPKTGKYEEMPIEAKAYFLDMEKAIEKMHESLEKGGLAFIVVAGGCLPNAVIESDEIIEQIAENAGFAKVDRILARKVPCMRDRTKFVGKTRESILVLEKW